MTLMTRFARRSIAAAVARSPVFPKTGAFSQPRAISQGVEQTASKEQMLHQKAVTSKRIAEDSRHVSLPTGTQNVHMSSKVQHRSAPVPAAPSKRGEETTNESITWNLPGTAPVENRDHTRKWNDIRRGGDNV